MTSNLTVCVIARGNAKLLERTLRSILKAKIDRISICFDDALPALRQTANDILNGNSISVSRSSLPSDSGDNNAAMLAAYWADTPQILVLRNGDEIAANFLEVYQSKLTRFLEVGVRFAVWTSDVILMDGTIQTGAKTSGKVRAAKTEELKPRAAAFGTPPIPICSCLFDRETFIHACKEVEATMNHNDNLPSAEIRLGTDVIAVLRHAKKFPHWIHADANLTLCGPFSALTCGNSRFVRGHDRARTHCLMREAPAPTPKLIWVHMKPEGNLEVEPRVVKAQQTWRIHEANMHLIPMGFTYGQFPRDGRMIGDTMPVTFVKDLLDQGCAIALPEDGVVYANADVGLTDEAPQRILRGLDRGRGVTVCPRRSVLNPRAGHLYHTVRNSPVDGGIDIVAVTPAYWQSFKSHMPDMLIGREAWDLCFRVLAEEWADGGGLHSYMSIQPEEWWRSKAYTDDVCWHVPHASPWKVDRATNMGGRYNRDLARKFFKDRNNEVGLRCVQDPGHLPPLPAEEIPIPAS